MVVLPCSFLSPHPHQQMDMNGLTLCFTETSDTNKYFHIKSIVSKSTFKKVLNNIMISEKP